MNKETIFKEQIEPLFNAVKKECVKNSVPFFATFCVADDEKESKYVRDMLSPSALHIPLTNDRFPDLVNVMNGFNTYLSNEDKEFSLNKVLREIPEDDIGSLGGEEDDDIE